MHDLLQQIDLDYYRSALLLVARADLERLRQECPADADAEKQHNSPMVASGLGTRQA